MKIFIALCRKYTVRPFTGNQGLYSAVEPDAESFAQIEDLFERAGFKNMEEDLHCTIMYSRKKVPKDLKEIYKFSAKSYRAEATRFRWNRGWDNRGLILLYLESLDLKKEHDRLEELGCESYSTDYLAHITVCKDFKFKDEETKETKLKYANRILRQFPLTVNFVDQSIQDIDQNWDQR